ncbi:MAG: hypothetical protein MUO63_07205 [Desulfobulbaceae bacterium]|nr:hypothetical protein [Desulfobulbaceae bacterium]
MESSKIDYDFKKSFIQKAIISGCIFIIACIIAGVVHHYFYYLDAFLYAYEFYWLFNIKNLQAANTALFVEYFKPMGIRTEALPQILLSHLIQNSFLPFSKPILVSAAKSAFGAGLGIFFSYIALLLTGLISFAIGSFFLGDILPILKRQGFGNFRQRMTSSPLASLILPLFFTLPWIPVSLVAIAGAFLKFPTKTIGRFMLLGLFLRVLWLLVTPSLFL